MTEIEFKIEGFYLSEMFRSDPVTGRPIAIGIVPSFMAVENFPVIFPVLYAFFEVSEVNGKENRLFEFEIQNEKDTALGRARFRIMPTPYPSMVAFTVQGPVAIQDPGKYLLKIREVDDEGSPKSNWSTLKSVTLLRRPDFGKIFQEKSIQEHLKKIMKDFQNSNFNKE